MLSQSLVLNEIRKVLLGRSIPNYFVVLTSKGKERNPKVILKLKHLQEKKKLTHNPGKSRSPICVKPCLSSPGYLSFCQSLCMWLIALKLQVIFTSVISASAKCKILYIFVQKCTFPLFTLQQVYKAVCQLLGSYIVFVFFIDKERKLYGVWIKHLSPYVCQRSGSYLTLLIFTDIKQK